LSNRAAFDFHSAVLSFSRLPLLISQLTLPIQVGQTLYLNNGRFQPVLPQLRTLHTRGAVLRCASRLPLDTSRKVKIAVDSLAGIMIYLADLSFTNLKTNDRAGN
jgi:hypothetical protein